MLNYNFKRTAMKLRIYLWVSATIFLTGSLGLTIDNRQKLPPYEGYLFVYFEGSGPAEQQEQLRFGVSAEGMMVTSSTKTVYVLLPSTTGRV